MKASNFLLIITILFFYSCKTEEINNTNTSNNNTSTSVVNNGTDVSFIANPNSPKIESDMLFYSSKELLTSDYSFIAINAETGTPIWKKSHKNVSLSRENLSPIVSEDIVYFSNILPNTGKETLFALNLLTGEEKWKFESDSPYTEYNLSYRATPTVANNIVYFPMGTNNTKLIALDSKTGKKLWEFVGTNGLSCPTVIDGIIYFYTKEKIWALNAKTGIEIWSHKQERFYSELCISENLLIVGGKVEIYALNAKTGAKIWTYNKFDLQPDKYDEGFYLHTTPTIENSKVFFIFETKLFSLDLKTGNKIWEVPCREVSGSYGVFVNTPNASFQSPNVYKGKVYFYNYIDKFIYAFNSDNGKQLWKFKSRSEGNRRAFDLVISDKLLFASHQGGIEAISQEEGTLKWRVPGDYFSTVSPIILTKDGKIFSSTFGGLKQ